MGGASRGDGHRRAFVEDARRNGQFLRVTWHGDRQQFVVSNWDGSVCVGATRVSVEEAPALIDVVAQGLADAAVHRRVATEPQPQSLIEHLGLWWRSRARGRPGLPLPDNASKRWRHTA
ncbi:MAG: hypothetical protein ACT452_11030 [Microthrixaceae bacterium]